MIEEPNKDPNNLLQVIAKLINVIIALIFIIVVLSVMLYNYLPDYNPEVKKSIAIAQPDSNGLFTDAAKKEALKSIDTTNYWHAPDESTLTGSEKEMVLYGKDLIAHTALYFGPTGKVFKNNTNGMNCQNCHLAGGSKLFGNNYASFISSYPKMSGRSGKVEPASERLEAFAQFVRDERKLAAQIVKESGQEPK